MEMSAEIKDIAKALSSFQSEIKPATKDAKNPFFNSKYADLVSIVETAKPLLAKHGLCVTQLLEPDADKATITTMLLHTSGQWIRGTISLKPTKNDPQGLGSAITYGRRYAYASILGIVAEEEDDDGNAASAKPKQETKPETKPAKKPEVKKEVTQNTGVTTLERLKSGLDNLVAQGTTVKGLEEWKKAMGPDIKNLLPSEVIELKEKYNQIKSDTFITEMNA